MDSTAKLVVGMTVTGTGIPGALSPLSTMLLLHFSADTTATNSNTTLMFGPPTGKEVTHMLHQHSLSSSQRTWDKSIKYMMRPVRMLDKHHVEMFRPTTIYTLRAQYGSNYFRYWW